MFMSECVRGKNSSLEKAFFARVLFKDKHKGDGSLSLRCHCSKMYETRGGFLEHNVLNSISFTHYFRSPLTHMQSIHSLIYKASMQSWRRPTVGCPRTKVERYPCVWVRLCVPARLGVLRCCRTRESALPPTPSYWKCWSEAKAFPATTNWMHLHAAT